MEQVHEAARSSLPLEEGEEILEAWHSWHYVNTAIGMPFPAGRPIKLSTSFFDKEGYLFLTTQRLIYVTSRGFGDGYQVVPRLSCSLRSVQRLEQTTSSSRSFGLFVDGAAYRLMRTSPLEAIQRIRAAKSQLEEPPARPPSVWMGSRPPPSSAPPAPSQPRYDREQTLFQGAPVVLVTCPRCHTLTPGDEPTCGSCGEPLPTVR